MTSKEKIDKEYASLSDKIHFDEESIDRTDIDEIVANSSLETAFEPGSV